MLKKKKCITVYPRICKIKVMDKTWLQNYYELGASNFTTKQKQKLKEDSYKSLLLLKTVYGSVVASRKSDC